MIVLKISNASELVVSKVGEFVERVTADFVDESTVENLVIKRMIENFVNECIAGEISSLKGFDIKEGHLILDEGVKVANYKKF